MLLSDENGLSVAQEKETESFTGAPPVAERNGILAANRLLEYVPTPSELGECRYVVPVLAILCFEEPDSRIGGFVSKLTEALARRHVPVHVFARKRFAVAAGVSLHVVGHGSADEEDLLARVQDFTQRACNAFLKQFPAGTRNIRLLGCEWSSIPAFSILRSIRKVEVLLSLHSLERQRSDMTDDVSKKIVDIELTGLREADTILVHGAATAEAVQEILPARASKVVQAPELFPVQQFANVLDAGSIKARYQVGPVDPTILFIGDLDERYGPDLLVRSMPGILKNNGQVRLIIVGEGNLYWPLRVYVRYLLLEHAVRLPGSVEGKALAELIQAADVIALPSRESTPWWPIQAAWAAGKPVVATHAAAPELLEHSQDSVLVYPSENSCVWGIERILFDPEFGRTLVGKGREKLDERFGWGNMAARVKELIAIEESC
jgi:glycosyltransferase involved in cell wall biosynthesis